MVTCGSLFFYLSYGLVWVCEIEIAHMSKNNRNSDLVCEKKIITNQGTSFSYVIQQVINTADMRYFGIYIENFT